MTSYYRVCTSVNDKGVLIPEGSNLNIYKKGEAYVSVFKYNDEHFKIFKERGTVAGITNVKTDTVFFDLDCGEDIEKARQDALEIVDRLTKKGISPKSISVCLSGAKGFHVSLVADREYTPDQIKSLATNLAGDLPSFDSVVYNANRIIRLEGSIHPKTGLRKTRITLEELRKLPITDIMNISKELYEFEKLPKAKIPEGLFIPDKALESTKMVTDITQGVDYLSNPFGFEPRMLALSQGFFPSGQRNNSIMRLAAKYRGKGLDRETAFALCNIACEKQAAIHKCEKFSENDLQKHIIDQIYSTTWKGGTYTEHDMPSQLKQYFDEMGVPSMLEFSDKDESVRITDSFDSFARYAREAEKNTVKLGIPELDDQVRIMKGHLISVLAPPGVGKTSLLMTFLNNTSKTNQRSYFACYDMDRNTTVAKLIIRHTGESFDQVFQAFLDNDVVKIEHYKKLLKENYNNVTFNFKTGQSIDDLKKAIKSEELRTGEIIDLVAVDYLELIKTDVSDPTSSSASAINGLREIANNGKVVIVLLQPNKVSSKPNEPILSYNAAKGSSMLAQCVTMMMTMHRPGLSSETPENDEFMGVNIVKNRMGGLFAVDFKWDGPSQTVRSLTNDEKFRLSMLRETLRDRDDGNDGY